MWIFIYIFLIDSRFHLHLHFTLCFNVSAARFSWFLFLLAVSAGPLHSDRRWVQLKLHSLFSRFLFLLTVPKHWTSPVRQSATYIHLDSRSTPLFHPLFYHLTFGCQTHQINKTKKRFLKIKSSFIYPVVGNLLLNNPDPGL